MGSPKERSSGSTVAGNIGEEASLSEPTRQLQAVYDYGDKSQGMSAWVITVNIAPYPIYF